MATVEIRNLFKRFGKAEVLRDVSLDIEDGEFIVLIGPSGCGKSTLLRMIAGLEPISAGTIAIDGEVVNELSPRQRGISMVFQSYALYPHMTSADNMTFSLRLAGESADVQREKLAKVADVLGLEDYLERLPRQLSGGQRQRVAMGRAIVREPKVFLFDEPLSNLDAKLRVQMRSEIRLLQQRLKVTSVYVTHDQVEALTMSDRVMLLNKGRIEQFAPPLDLYDRPANTFVAGFVGSPPMNLVDARAEGEAVAALGTTFPRVASPDAGELVLGFRPEHIVIGDESPGAFPARVLLSENSGDRLLIVMDADGQQLNASLTERLPVAPGETVWCTLAPDHIHLFDRASGRRLD